MNQVLWFGLQDLRAAMPPVSLIQNDDAALAAAVEGLPEPLCQWPLPKAIVMEKGESLEEFSQRSAPDFFTSLQVHILPAPVHKVSYITL